MELGRDVPDSRLREIIASQKPNQCCTLIYTSGTTGQPKGAMLSHDNVSAQCQPATELGGTPRDHQSSPWPCPDPPTIPP